MPNLLVSVRDVDEAILALQTQCIQILDVKEPLNGSLGAAAPATWASIAEIVQIAQSGDSPNLLASIAMGELIGDNIQNLSRMVKHESVPHYDFAKIGLAGCGKIKDWRTRWQSWKSQLPTTTRAVAVAYADWEFANSPNPADVIETAIVGGAAGVLLDTKGKSLPLFSLTELNEIRLLIQEAHDAKLWFALAGSLDAKTIPAAVLMTPDIIAIRGAACAGDRSNRISATAIREIAALISASNSANPIKTRARI